MSTTIFFLCVTAFRRIVHLMPLSRGILVSFLFTISGWCMRSFDAWCFLYFSFQVDAVITSRNHSTICVYIINARPSFCESDCRGGYNNLLMNVWTAFFLCGPFDSYSVVDNDSMTFSYLRNHPIMARCPANLIVWKEYSLISVLLNRDAVLWLCNLLLLIFHNLITK